MTQKLCYMQSVYEQESQLLSYTKTALPSENDVEKKLIVRPRMFQKCALDLSILPDHYSLRLKSSAKIVDHICTIITKHWDPRETEWHLH